jgi:hypothetical protein
VLRRPPSSHPTASNPARPRINKQPDLVNWVQQRKDDTSPIPGKQRLLVASASEARGILEGLKYWGLA